MGKIEEFEGFSFEDFTMARIDSGLGDELIVRELEFVVSEKQAYHCGSLESLCELRYRSGDGIADDTIVLRSTDGHVAATWVKGHGRVALHRHPVSEAIEMAFENGQVDGAHHKMWVIDQIVRILVGSEKKYEELVKRACDGEDGPNTYAWDTGVAP